VEDGWLAIATATFLSVNSPASVANLYRFVSRHEIESPESLLQVDERTKKAALMRETSLKCVTFVGVPKVINSLASLTQALEIDVRDALEKKPLRTIANNDITELSSRGLNLFKSIYDPHTEKLLTKLGSYHPDFPAIILQHEYGALLADPAQWPSLGQVGRTLTSAAGVACLRAAGGVGPQLTSHVFGLLKARGFDETDVKVEWLASEEGATWVINTVDRFCDLMTETGATALRGQSKL